jgi:DNA-binding protein Alba
MDNHIFFIHSRKEKDKIIKDAIFAFSGGQKSLLIKGEGDEISTAVEIAEILKSRLFPGIEIDSISLGSRPFIDRKKKGNYYKNSNKNKKDLISKIEITLKTKSYM